MDAASQIGRSVPIGRPISGTVVYILDERMQPVPIGVPGELYIGGDGLAREYLNQPKLTAERFVADPFDNRRGSRLYKTGDQCRWLDDGTIEFLGRRDRQIKIRGYRVELGEIESVLLQHRAVAEVVVLAQSFNTSEKQLIAYVVREPNVAVLASDLSELAAERLPSYMHPQEFLFVDAIPLSPNGKIDYAKLPVPRGVRTLTSDAKPAATADEQRITNIWHELLGVNEIGVDDNFFHLGGHSLLAMQLISRLRDAYGVDVPLLSFFTTPTITALAELIIAAKLHSREADLATIAGEPSSARDEGEL
jgi:acyl carrier protein